MKNILIVSGHPDLTQSFANKIILNELKEKLPTAEFDLLDRNYPDYRFDVAKEQQRLINADIIVLEFPLYWYGTPALMKKWQEDVFVHGFSHGASGDKLKNKQLLLSFTSGAPEDMYAYGAPQNYPIEDFLVPLKQFATLTGMQWQDYVYSGALSYANRNDQAQLKQMQSKALLHAQKLITKLNALAK